MASDESTGSVVFDRAVEYYDQTRGFPPGVEQQVATLFQQAGSLNTISRVIEIGVGTGRIALPLAPHVKSIVGVDLSRPMMDRLRQKRTTQPIHLIEGDISRLPAASHKFDAAVAVHIFHLVPDWRGALAEVGRVLKPGALLLLGNNGRVPAQEIMWEAIRKATPPEKLPDAGARRTESDDFVQNAGWQVVGEYSIPFTFDETPQFYIDGVRNRIWSRLWRLSDDDIARCVDAVQAAVAVHFGDPHTAVTFETSFDIRAYLPPQA
jgi:ubiquinone/menaquinone biosynthesis C-methylase UbiE